MEKNSTTQVPEHARSDRFGTVFRKKHGSAIVSPNDRLGWAGNENDGRIQLVRSRLSNQWLTESESREEASALPTDVENRVFASRSSFMEVTPAIQALGYQQRGKRRIPVTWIPRDDKLVCVTLRYADSLRG